MKLDAEAERIKQEIDHYLTLPQIDDRLSLLLLRSIRHIMSRLPKPEEKNTALSLMREYEGIRDL